MPRASLQDIGFSLRFGGLVLGVTALVAAPASCGLDVEGEQFGTGEPSGSTGTGGAGGGGAGGSGGGQAVCMPDEVRPCYTGPAGTKDIGACKGGLETCAPDGSAWSACENEVVPASETCGTPVDDDCDGSVNEEGEGCMCTPGESQPCYSGPDGTQNNPPCMAGTQMCDGDGVGFGACMGEVKPGIENCATADDEDCDAVENGGNVDLDSGCVCIPGTMKSCYSGSGATENVGICKSGMATCNADGKGLGACLGEVLPKDEDCATKDVDENCDGQKGELCPGETQWSKRGGNASNQEANGVGVDGAGNVIIVGGFEGTIDLGGGTLTSAGSKDVFVAKFNSSGVHQWSKRYGGSGNDYASSVAVTAAGEIVLAGAFDSATIDFGGGAVMNQGSLDGFAAKLDAQGNQVWSKVLGAGAGQQATSVAVAPAGDVYVCGGYQGTPDFGTGTNLTNAGGQDYFLVKLLGATGATTWAKGFGDGATQSNCHVAADSGNNPILALKLEGSVNFGGGALVAQGVDIAVVKLNPNNGHIWSKRYGDGSFQEAKGVAVDSMDRVLVTGSFQGTVNFGPADVTAAGYDAFVLRLSQAGAHDTNKVFGGMQDQYGVDVAVGPNNSIVVVGKFDNAIDFGPGSVPVSNVSSEEGYVVKYDSAGAYVWSRTLTSNGAQMPLGVATTSAGSVAVAGSFTTSIDFGGGAANQHNSDGGTDIFVALLQN